MFFRKHTHDKIKKIDVLITSVVLGAIIAGAFGLKQKKHHDEQLGKPSKSLLRKFFEIILGK